MPRPSRTRGAIWALSGAEQARAIRTRELASRELVDALLARIAAINPLLNAYCTLSEQALADAAALDDELVREGPRGPLHGVPVSIKDLIVTKGLRTTFGSVLYAEYVPDEDDVVVERLRAAGAVILGKTNVPEFGYNGITDNQVFGPTRNPWNPALTPGGSSGGAAAAVASGLGSLAIGSDGGGSIRGPSSLCGLFGLKPSFGRVPLYPGCRLPEQPGASSWESLECLGPMTRTVEDSALLLSVIAGDDPRDRHSLPAAGFDPLAALQGAITGLRVAWCPNWGGATLDPEVLALTTRAAHAFEADLGCLVEAAEPDVYVTRQTFRAVVAHDTDLRTLRAIRRERSDDLSEALRAILDAGWSAEDFTSAAMERQRLANAA